VKNSKTASGKRAGGAKAASSMALARYLAAAKGGGAS